MAMQAEAPRVLVQSMQVLVKAVLVLSVRPVNTMGDLVLLESLIEMEAVAMLVVVPKVVFVQVVTGGSDRRGGGGGSVRGVVVVINPWWQLRVTATVVIVVVVVLLFPCWP